MRRTIEAIGACRHPVVAQIHGICVGGGLEIAGLADIRICGESSRFGVPINKLGLVMAYAEISSLISLAGESNAMEILLEGRVFDASEAKEMGLLNRIVTQAELLPACMEIAELWIRRSSPFGLRLSKEVLNETITGISMENALKLENRNQILAGVTADSVEARAAWAEKRDPVWKDASYLAKLTGWTQREVRALETVRSTLFPVRKR